MSDSDRPAAHVRILPPEEWDRLSMAWPWGPSGIKFNPQVMTGIVVAEEGGPGGLIVAYWCLFYALHAEPVWIHPQHRARVGLVRRLLGGLQDMLRSLGVDLAFAIIHPENPAAGLAQRLGFQKTLGDCYWIHSPGSREQAEKAIEEARAQAAPERRTA